VEPKLGSPSDSCGSTWNKNWAPQVICALTEELVHYLRKNILYKLLEQKVSESSYIYDSERTVVILPMEHVGWCDWPDTQTSQILQYFLFKFPFPKPVHVEMQSLPAHLPFCICLLLASPNYFKL
jgi:hypothetical protein